MDAAIIVLIIAVAILVIVAVGTLAVIRWQNRRSEQLRERFGPEYDHAVETSDSKRRAESELREREERVEQLRLRELEPEERTRLRQAWEKTQARFVDDPEAAVEDAQSLVDEAMSARGYPMADFDQRAADISVDYPHVVSNYRSARAIAEENQRGDADTEALRQAMVHYRALFDELLEVRRNVRDLPSRRERRRAS